MGSIRQALLLAADNDAAGSVILIIYLAIAVLVIAGLWTTFSKAGQPGWGSIIPFYNIILMLRIAGKPSWWILLYLIPFVNVVISILVALDVARNFGKGVGFGLGLAFFGFIFFPILGFGSAQYQPAIATS
jgi:hypothetical protein